MNRGILYIVLDFAFLAIAIYNAVISRGTFSGWCWTIASIAWIALIINAFISSNKA